MHISCTSYRDRFTAHFAIVVTEAPVSFPACLCDNAREGVYFLRIFLAFLRQGSLEANTSVVIFFFHGQDFPIRTFSKALYVFVFEGLQIQNSHGPSAI